MTDLLIIIYVSLVSLSPQRPLLDLEYLRNCLNIFSQSHIQKQPSIGVLRKRCSENMQQIYWRAPMTK